MEALDREGGDEGETLARRDDAEAVRLVLVAGELGEEFVVGNPGRGGEAGLGANAGPDLFGYGGGDADAAQILGHRSEEHTSELQSLMRISYDVFCLNKKKSNR